METQKEFVKRVITTEKDYISRLLKHLAIHKDKFEQCTNDEKIMVIDHLNKKYKDQTSINDKELYQRFKNLMRVRKVKSYEKWQELEEK